MYNSKNRSFCRTREVLGVISVLAVTLYRRRDANRIMNCDVNYCCSEFDLSATSRRSSRMLKLGSVVLLLAYVTDIMDFHGFAIYTHVRFTSRDGNEHYLFEIYCLPC